MAKKKQSSISPELIKANAKHQAKQGLKPAKRQHGDIEHGHGARGPPSLRLLDKHEVCAVANVTYPTLWAWMRAGKFPRGRICGGKSMWLSSEVEAWMAALPVRPLKGDGSQRKPHEHAAPYSHTGCGRNCACGRSRGAARMGAQAMAMK